MVRNLVPTLNYTWLLISIPASLVAGVFCVCGEDWFCVGDKTMNTRWTWFAGHIGTVNDPREETRNTEGTQMTN